jgi:uncharacterized membrane protein (GlpM family)
MFRAGVYTLSLVRLGEGIKSYRENTPTNGLSLHAFLKFVIGGSIIVGVTMLAEQMDPRYGGILAAAPMITTLAFLFTWSEAGRQTTQQLVISTFWFMIPTMLFLLAFYFLMSRFSLLLTLAGAYGIWIGATLIMNRIITSM